ncbi:alkaline phosphatase D family protein [Candidatus Nitrospira neomarina]|uniref:Alkaline phosphatase D family protein n=1 Tax=Candidatus Nitrospira neomarina TaxID=3020899 RepID=A0AA96K0W9_9BACT|nr:alkaline phosphatase D family protein [Candidatus Nitrospira neomarina]WNM62491.1 alkaline phosphatase D family protein [Candidatus Nitrospira neomarina]
MFDRIDAAVFSPGNNATYFFRKNEYLKFVDGRGVQTLAGSKVRRIGVDGWIGLPEPFKSDIDAALSYPNGFFYLFKGGQYVKWEPGVGVKPTYGGQKMRTIGVTGWVSFPDEFHYKIDAAMYDPQSEHVYFFKGQYYIMYKPDAGVVRTRDGQKIRQLGITGWESFPDAFKQGIDSALYYPPDGHIYFFKEREYLRWDMDENEVAPHYPRRLGLLHRESYGGVPGWPGLSTLLGGPFIGDVACNTATIWLWLTGGKTSDDIIVKLNHKVVTNPDYQKPETGTAIGEIREGIDGIDDKSLIQLLRFKHLESNTQYQVELARADDQSVIDQISFKTALPPSPLTPARIRIGLGSCANHIQATDLDTFSALQTKELDFLILCGDNCYYFRTNEKSTIKTGEPGPPDNPHDWASVTKMLKRQLQARNHPQFVPVARSLPIFSTWDDHDFSFNNCDGFYDKDLTEWVRRDNAAGVYRVMWNHPYRTDGNHIYYDFQWGPLHIFMTDGRYHSNRNAAKKERHILGPIQCQWLLDGLKESPAPLKLVVFSSQLIRTTSKNSAFEGFSKKAEGERALILDTIMNKVPGPVLVLSGDVHHSECQPYPEKSLKPKILEVTSSALGRKITARDISNPPTDGDTNRLWFTRHHSFAVIDINFLGWTQAGILGSVTIEAYDKNGKILDDLDSSFALLGKCRTEWNLLTRELKNELIISF